MPKLDTFEGVLQVLALGNYSRFSTALHPDAYTEDGIDPIERLFLIHLRKKSKELISYLASWLQISDADSRVVPLSSVEISYALQQAYALKACLTRSLALGLKSPIEGLTLEALNARLAGCFGDSIYENQENQQAANASFYCFDNYLVQRLEQPLFRSSNGEKSFLEILEINQLVMIGTDVFFEDDRVWMQSCQNLHN
jgi:hypothetical protein